MKKNRIIKAFASILLLCCNRIYSQQYGEMQIVNIPQNDTVQVVKWSKENSWEKVKEKARKENKYIFLDCVTTWCSWCKMMNVTTFVDTSLSELINSKYISVKLQADTSLLDNDFIKSWYRDAKELTTQYHINGYPTYMAFNPNGEMVAKKSGATGVKEFKKFLNMAMEPGRRKFTDPYDQYDDFRKQFEQGKVNYKLLYPMIVEALGRNDDTSYLERLQKNIEINLKIYLLKKDILEKV
jgi:thioredoxin-related protein